MHKWINVHIMRDTKSHTLERKAKIGRSEGGSDQKHFHNSYFGSYNGKTDCQNFPSTVVHFGSLWGWGGGRFQVAGKKVIKETFAIKFFWNFSGSPS